MKKPRIAGSGPIGEVAVEILKSFGEIVIAEANSEEALLRVLDGAVGLVLRGDGIGNSKVEEDLIPTIEIDAEVMLQDLTLEILRRIKSLSPFGPGNPEPLFYAKFLQVIDSKVVGGRHLKIKVKQGRSVTEAIGFGLSDKHPLEGEIIDMVFTPEIKEWQGFEKIQLKIIDLKIVSES